MLSLKIKTAIENHSEIKYYIQQKYGNLSWAQFTRTQYSYIAEKINLKVSEIVKKHPFYIKQRLILGNDMFYSICHRLNVTDEDQLINYLHTQNAMKPFSWISGKALESYWKESNPKEVKLNTLLVFLEIPMNEWEEWKYANTLDSNIASSNTVDLKENQSFLQHYIGSYFLYCPKTDHSQKVLKCPFVIKPHHGEIIAETITEGHRYISDPISRLEGHIQIICKNLDWNETESHLFNIGLKTKPEVLFGVSVTLSVNMGTPVALKNILVFQSTDTNFLANVKEKELNAADTNNSDLDNAALRYFEQNQAHIIFSEYSQKFEEFIQ